MDSNARLWQHCLACATRSDIGLRRGNNQDALAVALAGSQQDWRRRGHLFVVADGMGAHAAGELASHIAAEVIPLTYQKLADRPPDQALLEALHDANAQIHRRAQSEPEFQGMGTTSTALLLLPQGALIAHVGDSRAYRLRGTRLEQWTFDHSLVWELRRSGHLAEDATADLIPRNVITRSLGLHPEVQVDLEGPVPVQPGDTLLLCTDGLSGQLSDQEIGIVLSLLPPEEAADALVNLANLRGGPDNITLIVAKVTAPQVARHDGRSAAQAEELPPPQPIHPALWALMGLFGVVSLTLLILGHPGWALLGLAGLGAAAVAAVVQRTRLPRDQSGPAIGRSGRGPYATCECVPDAEFIQTLTQMIDELQQTAHQQGWQLDWERFHGWVRRAASAEQRADFPQAAADYLRAINLLMRQLKQNRPAGGESVLDP